MSFFSNITKNGKIKKIKKEIDEIERKRSRSQSALVQAILTHSDPDEQDVEFFNMYTAQIEQLRHKMAELNI
ncbi:MAG: hypothetical protein Q4C12_03240 [Clostridia bacterium]|nr:hypothetical protein [Clostridia bacterium]